MPFEPRRHWGTPDRCLRCGDKCRPEAADDVISGMAIDYLGMGDSRSNGSIGIRGVDFVSNERTNMTKPIPIARSFI